MSDGFFSCSLHTITLGNFICGYKKTSAACTWRVMFGAKHVIAAVTVTTHADMAAGRDASGVTGVAAAAAAAAGG